MQAKPALSTIFTDRYRLPTRSADQLALASRLRRSSPQPVITVGSPRHLYLGPLLQIYSLHRHLQPLGPQEPHHQQLPTYSSARVSAKPHPFCEGTRWLSLKITSVAARRTAAALHLGGGGGRSAPRRHPRTAQSLSQKPSWLDARNSTAVAISSGRPILRHEIVNKKVLSFLRKDVENRSIDRPRTTVHSRKSINPRVTHRPHPRKQTHCRFARRVSTPAPRNPHTHNGRVQDDRTLRR